MLASPSTSHARMPPTINREFLDWQSSLGERPFFAFLNYFDAHDPYLAPSASPAHREAAPKSRAEFQMLRDWQKIDKTPLSPADIKLASDAYDDCIASLDHDLGVLISELERRGTFDHTLLILTADHGEQFGEHGKFGHGMSVYEPEVHVPLLIVSPGQVPSGRTVQRSRQPSRHSGDCRRITRLRAGISFPRTVAGPDVAAGTRPGHSLDFTCHSPSCTLPSKTQSSRATRAPSKDP